MLKDINIQQQVLRINSKIILCYAPGSPGMGVQWEADGR